MKKQPIRIAQIMGNMNGGGVESVVMNYYRHIDRQCIQFDFIVSSDSQQIPREEIETLGGRIFEVPSYSKPFAYQRELRKLFEQEQWKIVHSHINALSLFPLRAAKKSNVPVRIAHSHSTSGKGELVRNAIKGVLKCFSNIYPTHRFACGEYAGQWLFGRNAEFWVMSNAIELHTFSFSPEKRSVIRKELGLEENDFLVLHIGRFAKQKNHSFLIEIFNELLSMRPNTYLLLAGDGPLVPAIKEQLNLLGIEQKAHFLGQRSDVDSLYSAADCFCLPSLYEGLPVVSVEAQASALPIFMSDNVSDEALITKRATEIALSDGPRGWASKLAEITAEKKMSPLSETDNDALSHYDIVIQSNLLKEKYMQLFQEAGE